MITKFCSKNGADPLNSPFTSGAEHSKMIADTGRITSGIGALQVIIVTNRAERGGSSVNRGAIRCRPRGAPIIDPV